MTTATKTKADKYTPAMIAAMRAVEPLNLEKVTALAATEAFQKAGVTGRSIAAKARTAGIAYEAAKRTTKTGEPVAAKADLVKEIAKALGVNSIESLEKAEKAALRKLLDAVTAIKAE
jgi:hypothetical protein